MLINLFNKYLQAYYPEKNISTGLPDIALETSGADLNEISIEADKLRVRLYIQRIRYAFKSIFLLYWYVAYCYLGFINTYYIAFWLAFILAMDINILRITGQNKQNLEASSNIKALEVNINLWHCLSALSWSLGGFLLATNNAVTIEMQYLHVVFGVGIVALAVPIMAASFRGLISFILCSSVFNLIYLSQHMDKLSLWFYGYIGLLLSCTHIGYQMHKHTKEHLQALAVNQLMSLRLGAQNEELHQHANIDGLTGLHNRRYVVDQFEKMYNKATRYHSPCSILLIDIDYFKKVNDVHGHLVGDDVLVEVAQLLQRALRDSDLIGRYGGEEFLALLPMTNLLEAQILAERLREQVENSEEIKRQHGFGVTVSIGVAQITDHDTQKQLIQRADEALYKAKAAGRNRVVLA